MTSNAFIGLPWPKKAAGIRTSEVLTGSAVTIEPSSMPVATPQPAVSLEVAVITPYTAYPLPLTRAPLRPMAPGR
ncbi:hypothetical protein [Micromonospora echinospora]|uniref:hypothetical protein n=1 Tax=Micromonospora echinospora TaxID=1877 RepID=UPI00366F4E14